MPLVYTSIVEAYNAACVLQDLDNLDRVVAEGIFSRADNGVARDLTNQIVTPSIYFLYHDNVPYKQTSGSPIRLLVWVRCYEFVGSAADFERLQRILRTTTAIFLFDAQAGLITIR